MKVLITGGAGFIGSHLTKRLLDENHQVIAIDNLDNYYPESEKRDNIAEFINLENYLFFHEDLLNKDRIVELVGKIKPDVVFHLAARPGVRPSIKDPDLYFQNNVLGTINILEAVKNIKGIKLIFASSSSVYGTNSKVPFSEEDALNNPASPYAASKISCESFCRSYAHTNDLNVIGLRFFTVYGKRQRPDLAIRIFIEKALKGEEIVMYGNGESSRDYTHVSDIVDGMMGAFTYNAKGYSVFNLGNSNPIKLSDIILTIEKILNTKINIKKEPMQTGDVPVTYADISKAKNLLGYNPSFSIENGIAEMAEWIKNKKF